MRTSPTPTTVRRRHAPLSRVLWAGVLVCLLVVGFATAGDAAPPKDKTLRDLQAKRDSLRSSKAKAAAQLDTLQATDAEITAALATLGNNISGQAARLEDAKRAVQEAEAEQAAAVAAEEAAKAELGTLKSTIKDQAIRAFTTSGTDDNLDLLSAESLTDAATKRTLREVQTTKGLDSAERYRSVQEDLALARQRSEEAAKRAADKREQVAGRLATLEAAQDEQEKFADAVEERIEAGLSESQSLAQLDTALSSEINNRQAQLAAELDAQRRAAQRRASSAGGRARSRNTNDQSVPSLPTSGGNGIVTVRGIRVDQSIGGSLERMMAAAEAEGIALSGGGYRDPAGQVAVRRSNCGSSNYAIYQAPASSCRPPTARPGRSMHEQGLAIDFTQGGRTLNRGSSAYGWLRANAASYGFYNLPSEPWHWSTNGN